MDPVDIRRHGDALYDCLRQRTTIAPLTTQQPDITVEDAYQISRRMLDRRIADGERIVGKKIGVTSKAVQDMLGVHRPDFGFLTDTMICVDGGEMPIGSELIQPRAEGEIAFVLAQDLTGPGVTGADVLAATSAVHVCFEVVDSRSEQWKIKIQDTIADNASCGMYVLGSDGVDPRGLDLNACRIVVMKNGAELSSGLGEATLGSPLEAVAWLANTLGEWDIRLNAGDVVLSGSLVPLEPVVPGDRMEASIEGIGSVSVRFV